MNLKEDESYVGVWREEEEEGNDVIIITKT